MDFTNIRKTYYKSWESSWSLYALQQNKKTGCLAVLKVKQRDEFQMRRPVSSENSSEDLASLCKQSNEDSTVNQRFSERTAQDYFWMINCNLMTLFLDLRGGKTLTADIFRVCDVH